MKPGHNKYDFEHSLALKPDVVVGGVPGRLSLAQLADYRKNSPYRCFAVIYFAPGFAADYVGADPQSVGDPERMPQFVGGKKTLLPAELTEMTRNFHALFVRRDSTRAKAPADWTAPR
jgi:hypothetical protein